MAQKEHSATQCAPGVPPAAVGIKPDPAWRRWDYFSTRLELNGTGLVPAGLLYPGELPSRGRCQFVARDGRKAGITKATWKGAGIFCLSARWNAADTAVAVKAAETAEALKEAKRRVSRMKRSADEYRAEAAEGAAMFLPLIAELAAGTAGTVPGGYRLDRDGLAEVREHIRGILETFRTARVELDPKQRELHREWCVREVRANDPAFVAMLGGLSGGAS